MKVSAPGKLLLSGAYAVLEGAPAVVFSVSRYAVADTDQMVPAPETWPEARAAFGDEPAPTCDVGQMYSDGRKLGIGSSAAALVAALGAMKAVDGGDLDDTRTRESIFRLARKAHAAAQSGGSGVDIAASTYGGAMQYILPDHGRSPEAQILKCTLPTGLYIDAFFTGVSARTSDLLAQVRDFRAKNERAGRRCMNDLADAAHAVSDAVERGSAYGVVHSSRLTQAALVALGQASGATIVPPAVTKLAAVAAETEDAFFVSGAGGGDVALRVSMSPVSDAFLGAASANGFQRLDLTYDRRGVHVASAGSSVASLDSVIPSAS